MPIEGHKFRIVVITQGADDVILVDEAGVVHEIPVNKIADDQVPFFSLSTLLVKLLAYLCK